MWRTSSTASEPTPWIQARSCTTTCAWRLCTWDASASGPSWTITVRDPNSERRPRCSPIATSGSVAARWPRRASVTTTGSLAASTEGDDHMTTPSTLERVHFFPRQLLTADDMDAEQHYFRQKLRRHTRFLHGWGVVCGCEVKPAYDT